MTRMTLTTDDTGRVTLAYEENDLGERVTREFTCPLNGGYVQEYRRDGDARQVCKRLASRGDTLTAPSRAALADVIRREYRAMRAADKRRAA